MKGYIYKITDKSTDNFYIGSTGGKTGLPQRKAQHINDTKRVANNKLNFRTYCDIIANNDYEYEIISEINDCSKEDLLNAECIQLNLHKVHYGDLLVNKILMKKRFDELNCDLGNII